jgi:Ribbon-helix-helix domain
MQDMSGSAVPETALNEPTHPEATSHRDEKVVSTHVLVPEAQAEKLRELSRKTRVAQSEYLREAVDDLLGKYHKRPGHES